MAAQHLPCAVPRREEAVTQVERMEPARGRAAIGNLLDALLIGSNFSLAEGGIVPWPFGRDGLFELRHSLTEGVARAQLFLARRGFDSNVLDELTLQ